MFCLVAQVVPKERIGSVTGIVGAIGGLGGFLPPLVMGAIRSAPGSYSMGLVLLSAGAFLALVLATYLARRKVTAKITIS